MCHSHIAVYIEPERKLRDLMTTELGVSIDKAALRLFIRHHWKAVAAYAHAIHDAPPALEGTEPKTD